VTELLTLEDIARRWKVAKEYAQRYLVKRPGFPDPAPGSTRKNKRWKQEDIERFLREEHA